MDLTNNCNLYDFFTLDSTIPLVASAQISDRFDIIGGPPTPLAATASASDSYQYIVDAGSLSEKRYRY